MYRDFDDHGPAGPTAFWKLNDDPADDEGAEPSRQPLPYVWEWTEVDSDEEDEDEDDEAEAEAEAENETEVEGGE